METRDLYKTKWQQVVYWEMYRLIFNLLLLISGLLFLFVVQCIKRINHYSSVYFEMAMFYIIIANVAYTCAYVYNIVLLKRLKTSDEEKISLRKFTCRTMIITGIVINFFGGMVELLYRLMR